MLRLAFYIVILLAASAKAQEPVSSLNFFGKNVVVPQPKPPRPFDSLSAEYVSTYVRQIQKEDIQPYLDTLLYYKDRYQLDDWLYYQTVRYMAQLISPKEVNYNRYTVYKWFLMNQSGYDVKLTTDGTHLLFYVQSNEMVYNIPYRMEDGRQYVCLNYHDFGTIDFDHLSFQEILSSPAHTSKVFCYSIKKLPELSTAAVVERNINYEDRDNVYSFRFKVNPLVKTWFKNYPVVDYSLQFNIPLSTTTYQSLLPELRTYLKGMNEKDGVDFLMHFTRYAFLFKPDSLVFGTEKRFSPEQTLLYDYSDCEDRSALFYYLVKELYHLPMVVVVYPNHVTVAVAFKKPSGRTIEYQGNFYSICEPSPQRYDLSIGQQLPEFKNKPFQIAYCYRP